MKEALVLIDIQNMYFEEGSYKLFEPEKAAFEASKVLERFRKDKKPIIHVKHNFDVNGKSNGEYLLDFNSAVKPNLNEIVISKNRPSAFYETGLKTKLDELGIDSLVVVGMMSHMCIDTNVREAQNYNYKVTLIHDACTTKDLDWNGNKIPAVTVHGSIMASLSGMFANVISAKEFLK